MWPESAAFSAAVLANTRRWSTKVEVLFGDDVILVDSVVDSGYVQLDNVAVRRELHMTFVDADGVLTPASAADLLSPKGTELRVSRGLYLPDGSVEYIPLGVFGLITSQVRSHSMGTVLEIKGFDRVDAVRVRRFTDAWTVAAGTLVSQAISDIVTSRIPDVPVRITPTTFTTTEVVFDRLTSPWDAVSTLAENANMIAYFDPLGSLVIGPLAYEETGLTYTVGSEVATLMNVERTFDQTDIYNGVIVNAEHPGQDPIHSELWDTVPTSPTYSDGPFGKRPYGYFSDIIATQAQADAVAATLYSQKVTGIPQTVEIYTLGTIGHDVGDKFTVVDPRSKTVGEWVIASGTIPLRATQEDLVRFRCIQAPA
jgi:hypothetical protein